MARTTTSFRVGRVQGYQRGKVWYLCYFEQGQRKRPRVGSDREAARMLAAQTNAQITVGAPGVLSFEPVAIAELRQRWLNHHEQVLRSSVSSIRRYRAATDHLLEFVRAVTPVRLVSGFTPQHAESFVAYLRQLEKAPNGHANACKRGLRDKGIKFILQVCRSMFTYARSRRHLSPYAENPFSVIGIDRMPIENAKPITILTPDQEVAFLKACDPWEFPIFLTLMLTGLRPGELTHLLLPDDLDISECLLRIRNKPELGWQIKTRNQRDIPLIPELVEVLRISIGQRTAGPVFLRKKHQPDSSASLAGKTGKELQQILEERIARIPSSEQPSNGSISRQQRLQFAAGIWRDAGAADADRIRTTFIHLTARIGLPEATAPKLLRHTFATCLQDANVDPLIRNQLMGHRPADGSKSGGGLGMTAVYTHSRPETIRQQLGMATAKRGIVSVAREWIQSRTATLQSQNAQTCG